MIVDNRTKQQINRCPFQVLFAKQSTCERARQESGNAYINYKNLCHIKSEKEKEKQRGEVTNCFSYSFHSSSHPLSSMSQAGANFASAICIKNYTLFDCLVFYFFKIKMCKLLFIGILFSFKLTTIVF